MTRYLTMTLSASTRFRKCLRTIAATLFLLLIPLGAKAQTFCPNGVKACPPEPELEKKTYGGQQSFTGGIFGGLIKDKEALIILGKALFWDEQAGSDGNACASCHFHAGADSRKTNQISPGLNNSALSTNELTFGITRSNTGTVALGAMPSKPNTAVQANHQLVKADMPLHKLINEEDRNSLIEWTTDDGVSSQGAYNSTLTKIPGKSGNEKCNPADDLFQTAHGFKTRRVEPRNTPTAINAAYYHRNFWDGRANNVFNGVGVFGPRDIKHDKTARLLYDKNGDGELSTSELTYLHMSNASLASQAVAPPLSDIEMSCAGRTFANVGRELLSSAVRPLENQEVHPNDSVLAPYRHPSGKGLTVRYEDLIMQAFADPWWNAQGTYIIEKDGTLKQVTSGKDIAKDSYTQMEHNFSMFWGIAIMAYETTLISDQSTFDKMIDSKELTITPGFGGGCQGSPDSVIAQGCQLFFDAGCIACHTVGNDPTGLHLFSDATFKAGENFEELAGFLPGDARANVPMQHDAGFHVLGVKPWWTDPGVGGTDKYGNPLSFSRQIKTGNNPDEVDGTYPFPLSPFQGGGTTTRLGVDGGFKTPILRNVALTAPYFHWGGYPNLESVIKFYNRGGNRRDYDDGTTDAEDRDTNGDGEMDLTCGKGDNSGSGPQGDTPYKDLDTLTDCGSNTTGIMQPLGLNNTDIAALVAFLKALTDERVQCSKPPFDHPQLHIVDGHKDQDSNGDGKADEILKVLPATGAAGGTCLQNTGDLFTMNDRLKTASRNGATG